MEGAISVFLTPTSGIALILFNSSEGNMKIYDPSDDH